MSKRARSNVAMSSSIDVNPQFMTLLTGAAPAVDDYTINRINLPIARIGGRKGKAIVLELLKVFWYVSIRDVVDANTVQFAFLTTNTARADTETATLATAQEDAGDALTFAFVIWDKGLVTTGGHSLIMPIVIDLTDGAGNGMLIATDQIFILCGGIGNTAGADAVAKVLYRFKEVGIEEYVGIVQSQQG